MQSRRTRWLAFLIAIAAGLGLGLYYGWVVRPVAYVDTAPNTLRADYKADYALMVAEAYQAEGDLPAARRALALLGAAPAVSVQNALTFGIAHGYASQDLYALQQLLAALQSRPIEGSSP
jgi:hypothetical protein